VALQAAKLRREMTEAEDRKQKRRIAHSKPGTIITKPARKKKIIAELE
jgi:WD repeat and SOF domain-containing protein 1